MSTDGLAFEEIEKALQSGDVHYASVQLEKLGTIGSAITDPKFWTLSAVYALLTLDISQVEHYLLQAEALKGWDEKYFLNIAGAAVRKRLQRRIPRFLFSQRESLYQAQLAIQFARYDNRYRTP